MATKADVHAWSRRKKLSNPFAGLRLWRRTNVPHSRTIISRHWPHLLCWSWTIWGYGPKARADYRKLGASWWNSVNRCGQARLGLGLVGFSLAWQDYDYMPSLGHRGADAPKIDWDEEHRVRNEGII